MKRGMRLEGARNGKASPLSLEALIPLDDPLNPRGFPSPRGCSIPSPLQLSCHNSLCLVLNYPI